MKKIIFTIICFLSICAIGYAHNDIDYTKTYPAGGRLLMAVDSAAKNVYYGSKFPNQPNTSFSYLPGVNNVSIEIYFRKKEKISDYRYTLLVDDKPVVVNKSIEIATLKEVVRPVATNNGEVLDYASLGVFSIKGRVLTVLVYSIENPLNIQKSIFYGKPFPKANIAAFIEHFKTDKGFEHKWMVAPEKKMSLTFEENDLSLTLVKNQTNIDYLYYTSIKNKQTDEIVFESPAWDFSILSEDGTSFMASIDIDKGVFKKSGEYEIIIQPSMNWKHCWQCGISDTEIESYISRYTLDITLENENYTKKEVYTYIIISVACIGLISLAALYSIKIRNKKRLAFKEQQENVAKLKLGSIRSQLNPHFLFNSLASIQNLMNKNEVDNANKYLSKFARLTRTVLEDKELISLSKEKSLLDDYLQMEQLRFGFKYEIKHDSELELDNIDIPSMLLQPFVENAVKHGIAQKTNYGIIAIAFTKQENNLVLSVTDNGNGFNTETKFKGFGLQLSKDRIALLNSIYKENHFILVIQSNSEGTKISITLTDWL